MTVASSDRRESGRLGPQPIRVCLGDDHLLVRHGVCRLLADHAGFEISGEASTADDLFRLLRQRRCDVLLLDFSLPGRDGLDTLHELRAEHPDLGVLVFDLHSAGDRGVRALRAGADGYVPRNCAPAELLEAIRKVYAGGRYVDLAVAEKLAESLSRPWDRLPHECLSDREYEVFCMLAAGESSAEIARRLFLSVKTVSTYRARLLEKMGMVSNAHLTLYAVRHHLIDLTA